MVASFGRSQTNASRSYCRQPAVVLAIATLIVLAFTAGGQSVADSSPRSRTDAASGARDGPHPPVVRSQGPGSEATLPPVSASGATVQALWQLRLIYPAIVGGTVVGLAEKGSAARIEAVSSLTGQPRWSVPTPAEPRVLGVSIKGSVVIVEAGRGSTIQRGRSSSKKSPCTRSPMVARSGMRRWLSGRSICRATSVRTWRGGSCSPNRVESSSLAGQRREASSGARAGHGRVRRVAVTKPAATRAWQRTAACWSPPTRANEVVDHMCSSSDSPQAAASQCGNGERSQSERETQPRSSAWRSSVWPRQARSCCCRDR